MTKSELKHGYIVRYRDGNLRMVMPLNDQDILVEMDACCPAWCPLNKFNEDLTCKEDKDLDIVEVYGFSTHKASVWVFDWHHRELLWKRPEKKKYTYAQLREILGEEFEVVG